MCKSDKFSEITTIGLLGGTFDPPHAGHKHLADIVLAKKLVDAVWFLPCWKHAFEKHSSSFRDRLVMCHLMVRGTPFVEVCMDEYFVEATCSVDVLEHICASYSDLNFRLILGADNYWTMNKWRSPSRVLELAPPIWVARPGVEELPESKNALWNAASFSSTEVRSHVAENDFKMVELETNPLIAQYIKREKLYR